MRQLACVACAFTLMVVVSCGTDRDVELPGSASSTVNRREENVDKSQEPIEDRLTAPPRNIVDELHRLGVDTTCSSHVPSAQEGDIFRDYMALIPEVLLNDMKARLAAAYMLDDSPYGGRFECLFSDKKSHYYVLFLNSRLFHTTLSEWIDKRDNDAFAQDGSEVTLQSEVTGGYLALLHTLLHENSHAYDLYHGVTPYFMEAMRPSSGIVRATPFTRGFWKDLRIPERDSDFAYRGLISPYGRGGRVGLRHAAEAYLALRKTPFASMYGSYSWVEDFAEMLTWRYLNKRYGVEYSVRVYSGSTLQAEFRPFNSSASTVRLPYIDAILH